MERKLLKDIPDVVQLKRYLMQELGKEQVGAC
jgi:hypothetical protein